MLILMGVKHLLFMKQLLSIAAICCLCTLFSNAQSAVTYPYEASLRTELFKGYPTLPDATADANYYTSELPAAKAVDGDDGKGKKKKNKKSKATAKGKAGCSAAKAGKPCCASKAAAENAKACKPGCEKECCASAKKD